MRRRPVGTAAIVVVVVALAACGGGSSKAKKATATTTAGPPTAPLTGLPVTGDLPVRPALEVKIANNVEVRPQTGLDEADVVYEERVEGSFTRLLAIFHSQLPDVVGPVRSVRFTDPDVVWPLGGVFAFSGGAPGPLAAIQKAPVRLVTENDSAAMFRDKSKSKTVEFTLFGHPSAMLAGGGDKPAPPPALFSYLGTGATFAGDPVISVLVPMSPDATFRPTYTWDAASKSWLRSVNGRPSKAFDGKQIAPANVVLQFTNYEGGAGSSDAKGVTVGEGEAWVFADGKVAKGKWIRADKTKPAKYVDAAGKPIKLVPGITWVQLVPQGEVPVVVAPPPPPSTTATTGR